MAETVASALDVAPIHREPDAASEQVTQALRGEPLTVDERREGWARVRTAYDYPGWIEDTALGGEPADDWLPAPGGDPLHEARGYLGAPYLWGGMSARGIDCSGLVHMAYRRCGWLVPRDAHQQEHAGDDLTPDDVVPGDLVTYSDAGGGAAASHIAFWLGDGRILHATARDDASGVLEEDEPEELRGRRRRFVRL